MFVVAYAPAHEGAWRHVNQQGACEARCWLFGPGKLRCIPCEAAAGRPSPALVSRDGDFQELQQLNQKTDYEDSIDLLAKKKNQSLTEGISPEIENFS